MNEDPKARLIRELRAEIDRLRAEQGSQDGDDIGTMQEILSLRNALKVLLLLEYQRLYSVL